MPRFFFIFADLGVGEGAEVVDAENKTTFEMKSVLNPNLRNRVEVKSKKIQVISRVKFKKVQHAPP